MLPTFLVKPNYHWPNGDLTKNNPPPQWGNVLDLFNNPPIKKLYLKVNI
jgi:hypothetical protein